ncbi:MAG: shikimate kinase [Terriglobia bacterium]
MIHKTKIFLVGFMGSGKSTIGPLLSRLLNWEFIDLDQEIEREEGRSVRQIFAEQGEAYFRECEARLLQSLKAKGPSVIALGGGAFVRPSNRDLIHELGYSVFLDCPLEILIQRCPQDGSRPLWLSSESVESLYAARVPVYQKSDFRIDVSTQTPEQIASAVLAHWNTRRSDGASEQPPSNDP